MSIERNFQHLLIQYFTSEWATRTSRTSTKTHGRPAHHAQVKQRPSAVKSTSPTEWLPNISDTRGTVAIRPPFTKRHSEEEPSVSPGALPSACCESPLILKGEPQQPSACLPRKGHCSFEGSPKTIGNLHTTVPASFAIGESHWDQEHKGASNHPLSLWSTMPVYQHPQTIAPSEPLHSPSNQSHKGLLPRSLPSTCRSTYTVTWTHLATSSKHQGTFLQWISSTFGWCGRQNGIIYWTFAELLSDIFLNLFSWTSYGFWNVFD